MQEEEEEEEKEEEECVPVVLPIQHEMRMRSIILSSVDCPDLPYIPHYLINDTILVKKKLLDLNCVFIFSTTFV